jgi:spore germination protein GerM
MRRKLSLPAIFILIISAALSSCAPPPPPEMAPEASGAPENTGAIVIKSVRLNGASGQASAVPGETIMGSIAYQIWDQQDCPACRSQIVIGIGNDALDCAYNGVPGPHPGVFGTGGFDIFAPASPGQYDLLYKRTLADNCELARNFYEQSSPSSKDTIGTIVVAGAMPAKALSETAEVAGGPAGMEDVSGAAKEPLAEIAPEKEPSTAVQDAAGDAVSGEAMTVKIYYRNTKRDKRGTCSKVFPVRRPHTKTRSVARAALEELFKGPTQQEEAQGYSSRFSGKTASALKGIMIRKNTAYVNLNDLRTLMAEAGSSCGAVQLLSEMSHTVKQFRTVKSVIFAIEGSPKEFYDWLKIPCKEKNCYDPAPFQGR